MNNPEGTYWPSWERAVGCARKFAKNDVFTAHEFHEKCGIDYDTAAKYLPSIAGTDLGDGKKIIPTVVSTRGYVVDPPGEDSLARAREKCCNDCGCKQTRHDYASLVVVGAVGVAVGALIVFACISHQHSTGSFRAVAADSFVVWRNPYSSEMTPNASGFRRVS